MNDLALLEDLDNFSGHRNILRRMAEEAGEYAGIPVPIEDEELIVEPSYRFAAVVGRKPEEEPTDYKLRNSFWSQRARVHVCIFEEADGRITKGLVPGNYHVAMDLRTMGCSVAWGVEQEANALQLLATLLPHHRFKQYLMTGMFLETSRRSGIIYMFRKLKPTVAIALVDGGNNTKPIAALCMHPIGYYADSWAGAMCPTDDVIAHLQMMRGDEPFYWKRCNQIAPNRPEAGL